MDAESWLVGRYQLCRQIGAGGIGQVWTAHDAVLGREVAIKVQQVDPDDDHEAFERFVREARSAAALQHPNVVTIFDSGTDGATAFLVMELLPGPTLTGYLARHGPLPEREAVALSAQVASGLAAAHGAGVVHRDIKPANLMFDARGTLKIVDFGIARLTQTVATRLTARNAVIGSPPYLSPEQLQGQRADERSDIYCLGGVMMTMLTGRAPFEGTHPLALIQQHLNAAPPQVSDRRPGIDPALNALVAQMLSKSPEDRPQSALDVLNRLTGSNPDTSTRDAMAATVVDTSQASRPSPADAAFRAGPSVRPRQRSLLGHRDPGRRCGHGSGRGSCRRGRDDSRNSDRQSVRTIGCCPHADRGRGSFVDTVDQCSYAHSGRKPGPRNQRPAPRRPPPRAGRRREGRPHRGQPTRTGVSRVCSRPWPTCGLRCAMCRAAGRSMPRRPRS